MCGFTGKLSHSSRTHVGKMQKLCLKRRRWWQKWLWLYLDVSPSMCLPVLWSTQVLEFQAIVVVFVLALHRTIVDTKMKPRVDASNTVAANYSMLLKAKPFLCCE